MREFLADEFKVGDEVYCVRDKNIPIVKGKVLKLGTEPYSGQPAAEVQWPESATGRQTFDWIELKHLRKWNTE